MKNALVEKGLKKSKLSIDEYDALVDAEQKWRKEQTANRNRVVLMSIAVGVLCGLFWGIAIQKLFPLI